MEKDKKKFNPNDRVMVMSECKSSGKTGTVIKYTDYPEKYHRLYVLVKLDNGKFNQYREEHLMKV